MIAAEPTKSAPTLEQAALLRPWLAYPAAGMSFVAAAYLWTSIPTFLALYQELRVAVPAVVYLQLSYPHLLPVALVGAGLLALLATRPRVTRGTQRGRLARAGAGAGAVLLVLFSALMVYANALTLQVLQRGVEQGQGQDDVAGEVQRKLAWAERLPKPAPVLSSSPTVDVRRGETLAEAFAIISAKTGVRFRLASVLRARRTQVKLHGVSWERAVTLLARAAEASVYRAGPKDVILIPASPGTPTTVDLRPGTPLREAIEMIDIGIRVEVPDAVPNVEVALKFEYQPQLEVLEVLAVLADCRVEKTGQGLYRLVPALDPRFQPREKRAGASQQVPGIPWLRRIPGVLYRPLKTVSRAKPVEKMHAGELVETPFGQAYEVREVEPDGYLAKIGLRSGDKILAINGQPLPRGGGGQGLLDGLRRERRIAILVLRRGQRVVIPLEVEQR